VRTVRTAKTLDLVTSEIREAAAQIRQQLFPPKPGFACKYCDYELICPAHEGSF
jgi:CRISPR/Cas system-associated exonuclease Cas4 (RecB family)